MILDDFLRQSGIADRMAEHDRWQEEQRQRALQGPLQAVLPTAQVVASGLGLTMEGLANLGKLAGGIGLAGTGKLLPGMSEFTDAAAREYEIAGGNNYATQNDAGLQARALMRAHEASADVNPYITGAMDMLTDPTNLIPIGPATKLKGAAQARIADRAAAGSELSDNFLQTLYDVPAGPRRPTAVDKKVAKQFAKKLELDERLNDAQANVATAFARGGYAEQLQDIGSRLKGADGEVDVAATMYRQSKESQKEFVKSAEGQEPENAKAWFQELMEEEGLEAGTDFPKAGQSFSSFMSDKNQLLFQLRRAEEKLRSKLESALSGDELDLLNPWDRELVPGVKDTRKAADRNAFRSAELGRINERYNAAELADAIPAEGDELYALSDGPFAKAEALPPDSPQAIRERVTTITNAKPMATAPEAESLVLAPPGDWEGSYMGRMAELARFIGADMAKTMKESATRKYASPGEVIKAVPGMWKAMQVENPRNWLMDRIFNGFLLGHEGVGQGVYSSAEKQLLTRVVQGEKNEARLFGGVADIGNIHEWEELADDVIPKDVNKKFQNAIGGSLVELELDNSMQLNAIQQFAVNTGLGMLNPTRAVTNVALMPLGAAGEVRSRVFRIFNNVSHLAARSLAFESAYNPYIENSARRLLEAAASEGLDVSALQGKPLVSLGRTVGTEGGFGPKQVTEALGARYGAEWKRMIGEAKEAGFAESKRVFGNYSKQGPVEKAIAPFFPFMSWAWRAYPRIGSMLLQHPALLAGMYQFYRVSTANDKAEGRKGYQYGTIGVDSDTPLVGLFASLFTPEQEGEVRANPFSLFSPVGGEQIGALAGEAEDGRNENLYQQIDQIAGMAGMSFNPLIQAGAYVADWDYKSPGAFSRYAPIDQVIDEVAPGLPGNDVPTLQGPLRGLREMVGKAQGEYRKDTYDPIERKAKELVFEETGKPVSDKSNNKLAAEIRDKGAIYQRAERLVDTGGAARASFNTFSPLSVMANTDTGEEIRKTKKAVPYTSNDVYAAKQAGAPTLAALLQAEIDAYKKANPAAAAQDRPAYIR